MRSHQTPEIVAFFDQYQYSIEQPEAFWAEQAQALISWDKPWQSVMTGSLQKGTVRWFEGARLNACYNCVDRHLPLNQHKVAIHWEGNQPNEYSDITYAELHDSICRFANVLKLHRIGKGDVVCLYMPMIPEAVIAMLACARIGAVHSVIFGGFSAEALQLRLEQTNCKVLITSDVSYRGDKTIRLKHHADMALENYKKIHTIIVVKRGLDTTVPMQPERDYWYHEQIRTQKPTCPITFVDANDPLFILYTSGSTGHPKGIVHASAGYLTYAATTFKHVFDYKEDDIFFCTADIGWITGHTYFVYGPMCLGATQVMFEGIPTYPSNQRYWQIIDKYKVTTFYTAPTAIRSLMRDGEASLASSSRDSLRILGSVGEPINHEAWEWYYNEVGKQRCPIVDTWWQTETGGIMITPLAHITPQKAGAASWAFFGITPAIVDKNGHIQEGVCEGDLVITSAWPGMMQTIYQDQKRMLETYFSKYPGYYLTGDAARRDEEGYYWIIGRNDDVLNVSGHRIGTAELESAIGETAGVAESAVVDVPHDIKGHSIYAFVILKKNTVASDQLRQAILNNVTRIIGAFAKPETIQWCRDLPKTRSGKIMRRILRQIATGNIDELGDTSTLSNPEIIAELLAKDETHPEDFR